MRPDEKAVDQIMSADAAARPASDPAPLPIVLKIPWLANDAPAAKTVAHEPSEKKNIETEPGKTKLPASETCERPDGVIGGTEAADRGLTPPALSRRFAIWIGGCLVGVAAALVCDQAAWFHDAVAQLGFGHATEYELRPSEVMPPLTDRDPRIPDDPAPAQALIPSDEPGAATLAPEIIPIDEPSR